jgi:hypothetical protein
MKSRLKKVRNEISAETLREAAAYDPMTGLFFWRDRPQHHFKCEGHWRGWHKVKKQGPFGCKSGRYLRTNMAGVGYLLHRLAFLYMTGMMPDEVDHENQVKTDNRWDNLQATTSLGNQRNQPLSRSNTSGVCGVSLHKATGKWTSYISIKKKRVTLGLFADRLEAICARKSAEVKYGFHLNHGKLPAISNQAAVLQ